MKNWKLNFCCLLLISVMSAGLGLEVTMSQPSLEVARGDDVTLTCTFTPKKQNNPLIIITWSGDADGTANKVIFGTYYSENNLVDIGPDYEGKASIVTDLKDRRSMLTLKQVSMKESRNIRCYVQIPGDNEGITSDTTFLLVQVAPSQPICKLVGTAEYGQNVSLTCVSEEGSPTPTYKWEGYDVKNVPRPFPAKTTEKDGVLSLFNVSIGMSGFYVCLSSNNIGSAKCNFTMSVMPPSMNIASTLGIVGGCIAGIAVLILVIYCCCRKGKQKPEEYEMGAPEVESHFTPQVVVAEEYKDQRMENIEEQTGKLNNGDLSDRYSDRKGSRDDLSDQYRDRKGIREDLTDRYSDRKGSRDDLSDRYSDRKGIRDDLSDRYSDRKGSRDDLSDRYSDRKGIRDDLSDQYSDRKGSRDDLNDRYSDRKGIRDDLSDRYSDRKGSRDDLNDRCSDRKGSRDDLRDRYDERRGSRDDLRDRYNERKGSRDDLRDRYDERRGSRDDLRDQYDERKGSRDDLRVWYDDRRGSRDNLRDGYDDQRERFRYN